MAGKEKIFAPAAGRDSRGGRIGEGGGGLPERSQAGRARWGKGGRRYALAVGVVGAATAVRWILDPLFGTGKQFLVFYPAVAVAALLGGARQGLLATVLSALVVDVFFQEPRGSLKVEGLSDWVALGLFTSAGALISWMAKRMDRGLRREAEAADREQATEALREQAALLNLAHDAIIVRGAGDQITFWSTGAEETYGWSREEALGQVTHELLKTHFPKPLAELSAEVTGKGRWEGELTHRRKDGREIVVASRWAVQRGQDGARVGILEINRDVTEWKQAEEARARLATIVECSADAIVSKTLDGTIQTWNAGAERIFGYRAEEVIGRPVTVLFPPERLGEEERVLAKLRRGEPIEQCETVRLTKDGQRLDVSLTISPIKDSAGRTIGAAKIARDIGDLVRAREVVARDKQKLERLVTERTAKLQELVGELEHFSYTITHDLKSPLRAMRGFAEIAAMVCGDAVQEEAKEALGKISTAAERMEGLITDALNYSRSVREELRLTDVDTGALLRGILDSYPELQPSKAHIQVEGKLPVVLGNEAGLTQCFSNLLGNAVKFVRPGERPQIRVWAEERGGWARIWVEDKGIGISKDMLPRVFDMFSRGSSDYEGTGIGLALVRKVTQRMGGRAGVESEEGEGSRFWIELKPGEVRMEPGRVEVGPAEPRGGTALYVEDEESDVMFMKMAFAGKGLGSALRVVRDGRAAIEYLSGAGKYADRKEYPLPSVVLLDLNLPRVPGFEVLKWMRNHPDFARTPVLVFSSSMREDDRVKALELGANEFVGKPNSAMKFGEVVDRLQERLG